MPPSALWRPEQDNPPPRWWSLLLAVTLLLGLSYLLVSLVMQEQWGARQAHERALLAQEQRNLGDLGPLQPDRQTFTRIMGDRALASLGRNVFIANCATCHGISAQGSLIAPNLTDSHYLHVRSLEDLHDVIARGRRSGAMPAWANRLSDNELVLVTGYVASLKDRHIPGGKAPEGQRVEGEL